ncbi:MAG: hypothetical protein WCF84_13205 [Anaerolineae bacterium]
MNNVPEWLKPGALIEFAFCVGEIVDIAVSPERVMLLVKSPKGIWRNHPAEWLEFKPEAIKPATLERAARDIDLYREYITCMLADLEALKSAWVHSSEPEAIPAAAPSSPPAPL